MSAGCAIYTEHELLGFTEEFAATRRRQRLAYAPLAASLLLFMLADTHTIALAAAGLAFIGAAAGFTLGNWRCPACRCYAWRSFALHHCADCGVPLTSDFSWR